MRRAKRTVAALVTLLLGGCVTKVVPADRFFANLRTLCGKAYAGRVVSTDAADADMRGKPLVMHVRECSAEAIRIPFHVGVDRSRTWVLTRGFVFTPPNHSYEVTFLQHDHRHPDGSADTLTNYGGVSTADGVNGKHEFLADGFSQELFRTKGNPASATNVWTMEFVSPAVFAYQLRRPNRFFRVEFDLTMPVPAPPPPWGAR